MLLARFFRMTSQQIYSLTSMVLAVATRESRAHPTVALRWNRVPGAASEPYCIDVTA
jgi:hypothetical protein